MISQFIYAISKVLQKLLNNLNGTIIWTSFIPLFPVWPVIFCLDLNKALSGPLGTLIITPLLLKGSSV